MKDTVNCAIICKCCKINTNVSTILNIINTYYDYTFNKLVIDSTNVNKIINALYNIDISLDNIIDIL